MDGSVDSCSDQPGGVLTCEIAGYDPSQYYETLSTGDSGMKGMGFLHPGYDGVNTMSYRGGGPWVTSHPRDVSDSQIAIVRKFLRWDEPFTTANYDDIYAGFNYFPYPVTSGERPRLGSYRQRQPAAKLDFDGDGLRDIGVWIPPTTTSGTGEFIVLLSSNGYSQSPGQYMDVHFGGLGDTPVPADYDGDGRTDLAVFQPGGGINRDDLTNTAGYWRWCPTAHPATATTCSSPTVVQFGSRNDVPLPALDFDGTPPDALALFRPSTGNYYFKEIAWSGYDTVSMSTGRSAVPLPGLYDCDNESDLAVYEPLSAKFKLVLSSNNWNPSQMITRQFSTDFIPNAGGDLTSVAGVVPVAGQRYKRYCWVNNRYVPRSRLSAELFFPQDGSWNLMLDPIGSGSVISCSFGLGEMVPVGGTDWNGDGQSDMLLYDGFGYGPGDYTLWVQDATESDCSGSISYHMDPGGVQRWRTRAYSVSDMDGDGVNDIMIVDPDEGT